MKRIIIFSALIFCFLFESVSAQVEYPSAFYDSTAFDTLKVRITDPYGWLEDVESSQTLSWLGVQDSLTRGFIDAISARVKIHARLTRIMDHPRHSSVSRRGPWYFFSKNNGLQPQDVLYGQIGLRGTPRVVVDPNLWSPDGTTSLARSGFSYDGSQMAVGKAEKASDWQTLQPLNVETGAYSKEILKRIKFSSIAWTHDNKGFFYTRFPDSSSVPPEDENNYMKVFYHLVGTEQASDNLVYELSDEKKTGFYVAITEDGKYLVLYLYEGTKIENRIYIKKFGSKDGFVKLLDKKGARYEVVGNDGPIFYFRTTLSAAKWRVIAIDIRRPTVIREIVPEAKDVMEIVRVINDQIVVSYLHNAHSILKIYNKSGIEHREINLPVLGSVSNVAGRERDREMFFRFESFLYSPTIFIDNQPRIMV